MTPHGMVSSLLMVIVAGLLAAAEQPAPPTGASIYAPGDSLCGALLSSRTRFRLWQQRQRASCAAVRIDAWRVTTAVDANGHPLSDATAWTSHPEWLDGRVIQPLGRATTAQAVYVACTIHAARPAVLTVGIGGLRIDWWLNDAPGATVNVPLVGVRPADFRPALVELDLRPGENRLLLRLAPPDPRAKSPPSFWLSCDCQANVATLVWSRVRADFAATEFPFLDAVHHQWLDDTGWLGVAADRNWTQSEASRLIAACGEPRGNLARQEQNLLTRPDVADDSRWLRLAVAAAGRAQWNRQLEALGRAVDDLGRTFGDRYRGPAFSARLATIRSQAASLALDAWDRRDPLRRQLGEQFDTLRYEALVAANPLVSPGRLLFVKRKTYTPGWYYAEFMFANRLFDAQGQAAGGLHVLSLPDGRVTELVPQLRGGVFDRCDLSADGRRVVFAYKSGPRKAFRLYEVQLDGRGLRQLTFDPPDEAEHATAHRDYFHTTDDFHPCYLPDGGIVFASARCRRGVLCDQGGSLVVNVLYRIDADGRNLRRLSEGALSESTPAVMNDGRVLYTRWEYVDKGVIAVQALWAMRPDGSCTQEIYGNDIADPMVLIHGRAIPGQNHRFVCTATFHHPFAVGPIVTVDVNRPVDTLEPLCSLTPDTAASPTILKQQTGQWGEIFAHRRNQRWDADHRGPLFSEPYPLAEPGTLKGAGKYFLVDCNPSEPWGHPSAYGLYLIDTFGNRVRIHSDPQISCWQPIPIQRRPGLPVLPPQSETIAGPTAEATGTLVLADVYRGLPGVPRGTVRYLRVLEQVARPWSARRFWPGDSALGQHAPVSKNAHVHVKVHHGVVPVLADGSAQFTVPAERNIFLQALDENFMEVQRMRTFVNLRPGERRSCVGCHEGRTAAPPLAGMPAALRSAAVRPGPQPGERVPRPIHYVTDVQPILDRHCVACHSGPRPDGKLDLTGTLTELFNRSYENIMDRNLVAVVGEFVGPRSDQFSHVVPLPPRALGSHASKLLTILQAGHGSVRLSREEMIRLATWIDANAPYYGTYFGRRNLLYREQPDFRPVPTLESALGIAAPPSVAARP